MIHSVSPFDNSDAARVIRAAAAMDCSPISLAINGLISIGLKTLKAEGHQCNVCTRDKQITIQAQTDPMYSPTQATAMEWN